MPLPIGSKNIVIIPFNISLIFLENQRYPNTNHFDTTCIMPGGFTLHMTGYAPACTKSVEKGSFLDIWWRRRLLQKGYSFRC